MAVSTIRVPPGTQHVVGLLLTDQLVGGQGFAPGSIAPAINSSFSSGLPVYPAVIEGPPINGTTNERNQWGVNDSSNQGIPAAGAGNGLGLGMVLNVPYPFDPSQSSGGNRSLTRATGGLLSVANPIYAEGAATDDTGERAGQDIRAFLYAIDEDTATQAVRLRATAAGDLKVNTGAISSTITTVNDINMVVATNVLLAAANLNRVQIIIQNISGTSTDINRVGDTNITGGRGIRIAPGESLTLTTTAAVFGRPEAGNGPMTVTEIVA